MATLLSVPMGLLSGLLAQSEISELLDELYYDGSPYGGQGLQVIYHHCVGTAAGTGPGVYTLGWTSTARTWAQYDAISN